MPVSTRASPCSLAAATDSLSRIDLSKGLVNESRKSNTDTHVVDTAHPTRSEVLISAYLSSKTENGGLELKRKLGDLSPEDLVDFYMEALSFDFSDRGAFEAAGTALELIAAESPKLAVELLYSLSPAEKMRLATALANGWAKYDAVSAWDWIDSAWLD